MQGKNEGRRDKEVTGEKVAIKAKIDRMKWAWCEVMDVRE